MAQQLVTSGNAAIPYGHDRVRAIPFPNQFPANNTPGESSGPCDQTPATHVGVPAEAPSSWLQLSPFVSNDHPGSEPADRSPLPTAPPTHTLTPHVTDI